MPLCGAAPGSTMPKLSEDQQNQRRNRILDAAEACFTKTGFHNATMQDICKAAGISAGALYVYFASKEALIAGLAGRDRAEILGKVAHLADAPDFAAGLQMLMRSAIVEQPAHKMKLWLEIAAEATRNADVAKSFFECDGAIRSALENILRRAQAEGRIAPAMPAERITAVMSIIADGLIWRRAVRPDVDISSVAADMTSLIGSLVGVQDQTEASQQEAAQ
jgi:TetR/AcrR family transcriptional repressor of uid operon